MSAQYTKARYPWTSITPSQLSALDLSANVSDFRPTNWWGRPDEIFEQAMENDAAYLAFIESVGVEKFDLTQPIGKWRVGRPADMWTTNDLAIAASDTYIELADSLIVETGHLLHFTQYGRVYRVLDTDDDHSEGWTNGAAGACNIKVEAIAGPVVAIPAGNIASAGSAVMGESGTPSKGLTSVPGDPVWNTMQLVGIYGSITRVQMESDMIGGWGTHPKIKEEVYYQHRMRKQKDLLFGQRYFGTDSQGAQGQMWMSAGIVPQVKTHIVSAGELGVNLEWPKLNDFWEGTFDSELSSPVKDHFCGAAQFRDIRKTAMEYNADVEMIGVQSGVQNANTLGASMMRIVLQSGGIVNVHLLRKAFAEKNLIDWGITCDSRNLGFGSYRGISEAWFENIETPAQAITIRSDALIDTWMTCVKDESCFAVIRGGTRALVER